MYRCPRSHATDEQPERSAGIRRKWPYSRIGVPLVATLLAVGVLLTACGGGSIGSDGDSTSTSGGDGAISHPTGADEVVLQITVGGGFVPVEYNLTLVPQFSLYGDGTAIVAGPVAAIYPGPALPNLQSTVLSEGALQAILSAAREAGLFDPAFDYGIPGITDVATTNVVINVDGTTYVSDIYALGMEAEAGGLTPEQEQARAAVSAFVGSLMDPSTYEGEDVLLEPYEYSALAVYSQPVDPAVAVGGGEVEPNRLVWPLGDLGTLGEPVLPEGFRRFVVSGEDLDTLGPLLSEATMITLWQSGDGDYHLFFRPLLPEETP